MVLRHKNFGDFPKMIFVSFLPDLKVRSTIQQERCRRRFVEKLQLSKRWPKFIQFRDQDLDELVRRSRCRR